MLCCDVIPLANTGPEHRPSWIVRPAFSRAASLTRMRAAIDSGRLVITVSP